MKVRDEVRMSVSDAVYVRAVEEKKDRKAKEREKRVSR